MAFTKGIPIVICRKSFSVHQKFEKPPEKWGFSIENQKYKVYLFSNHSQRLVFTGPTLGRSNFVSGSPAPISSAKSLNRVTLTGVHRANELKKMIEEHGGKNVSSISKNTTFVLAGDNMGPSKKQKAENLGIPLLTEIEFLAKIS